MAQVDFDVILGLSTPNFFMVQDYSKDKIVPKSEERQSVRISAANSGLSNAHTLYTNK